MMKSTLRLLVLVLIQRVSAFQIGTRESSRRSFMEQAIVVATTAAIVPERALASGGATAGGAYLLSAKQRYNDRVEAGVAGFLGLETVLSNGDIDSLRAYFTTEDKGGWKDFSAAGYLLANAFRRNSSTPPDSLPAVKKWKAFAAEVENMTKALKKKDTKSATTIFKGALGPLDAYLGEVELPPAAEIK